MATMNLYKPFAPLTGSLVLDICLLGTVVYILACIRSWYRLRHIPGPFLNSISSIPLMYINLAGRSHLVQQNMSRMYGPVWRNGPGSVVISDVRHMQRMEAQKSDYRKGPWYGTFRLQQGRDHSFSTMDETKHASIKTRVGPGYAGSKQAEEAIERQLVRLVDLLDRSLLSGQPQSNKGSKFVDLAVLTQLVAIDIVGDMTFGHPFGFLDEGNDIYSWVKWNEDFFPVIATVGTLPWLATMFQWWPFCEFAPKTTDKTGLGRFIDIAEAAVDRCIRDQQQTNGVGTPKGKDMSSMIARFLSHGVTRDEAISEALVQVVAGTDTVANAVRISLLYIHSNPRVYNKLMAELDAWQATHSNRDRHVMIQDAEARKLPYLQAVIREGLRHFPPLAPLLNKQVPPGGDTMESTGHFLPGGTQVGIDVMSILRNADHWGPDVDVFRPERWLEAKDDEARAAHMHQCLDCIFGYGKYKCLGKTIAMMEINKTIVTLLLRYHLTWLEPTQPINKFHSAAFFLMTGMMVNITPRESLSPSPV